MSKNEKIEIYEDQPIRTAWNETKEEWYFFRRGCRARINRSALTAWRHELLGKAQGTAEKGRHRRTADKLSAVETEIHRRKESFDRCRYHRAAPPHHSVNPLQEGGAV